MLRKTATVDGKDWDKLILYVLFAYREGPQESTGFSPFELLYGRDVRGPLGVMKEEWEASPKSDTSIISHVMLKRERLEQVSMIVQETCDRHRHSRSFGTTKQPETGPWSQEIGY